MARPYQMLSMLWQPPRIPGSQRLRERLDKRLPENSKYYGHWGYTIYRTHYSPESDQKWDTLLDALKRQTMLAVGYYEDDDMWQQDGWVPNICEYKSKKEYLDDIKRLKELFHLDLREDPSLDGLGVHEIREMCLRDRPEEEGAMAGRQFNFVLLADKAVFEAMERGEFVIKAVSYEWEDGWGYWGWMRIPTGSLLALWHAFMGTDDYSHTVLRFYGPEEDLEEYVWPGSFAISPTSDCSEIRTNIHYSGQRTLYRVERTTEN